MGSQQILDDLATSIVANDFARGIRESFKRDDPTVIQGLLAGKLISVDARFTTESGYLQSRTLLMHAAASGADAVVTFLLAEGANPKLTDVGGKRAHDLAAERGRMALSGKLFKACMFSPFPRATVANTPAVF